jgi:hypothetical protein
MLHFEVGENNAIDLVLFVPNLNRVVERLAGLIERAYESYHRPDRVLLIIPDSCSQLYKSTLKVDEQFQHDLRRYGDKVEVIILSFDKGGVCQIVESNLTFKKSELIDVRDAVVNQGIKHLAKKNKVVEKSPPGSAFLKPSRSTKTDFIAAHRLAQSDVECAFISFCLLCKLGDISCYQTIYIDTSAISYLVLSTINLVNQLTESADFQPDFKSFHSYRGLATTSPNYGEKVLVLISASSSNNMANQILEQWKGKVSIQDVLTILSYKVGENVLCKIPNSSGSQSKNVERYVKRVDEYFTVEHSAPKSVVIKKLHGGKIKEWPFKALSDTECLRCNSPKRKGLPEKEMTINLESLPGETIEEIDLWWDQLINGHIPITTKYIVTDTNDEFLKKYIKKIEKKVDIVTIDFDDVINCNFESDQFAAVILLPVLGSGDKYISVNRDLRLAGHDGFRIFVSFFHLYKGELGLSNFKKSLLYGPALTKYKFFTKYSLNVPARFDKSCWDKEKEFLDNNPELLENEMLAARHQLLSTVSEGLGGQIGLNSRTPGRPLSFTRHFAFWNFKYDPENISAESVYFTIASILQSARDDFTDDPENSLEASPNQQALLSPDNFVRFNDPLLQSCLWRAAKGSELDYSSDEKLADDFVSIMERLSRAIHMERGEGFADLLLGVVIGKIVLSDKALDKLKALLTELLEANNNSTILALTEVLKR